MVHIRHVHGIKNAIIAKFIILLIVNDHKAATCLWNDLVAIVPVYFLNRHTLPCYYRKEPLGDIRQIDSLFWNKHVTFHNSMQLY